LGGGFGGLSQARRGGGPLSVDSEVRGGVQLFPPPPFIAISPVPGLRRGPSPQHHSAPTPFASPLAAARGTLRASIPELHIPQHLTASKIPCLGLIPCFPVGKRITSSPPYQYLLSPQHPCGCVKRRPCPRGASNPAWA